MQFQVASGKLRAKMQGIYCSQVERGAVMDAYYRRLTSENEETRIEAARRWSTWEMATSHLYINQEKVKKAEQEAVWAQQFARIEW